MSHTPTSQPKAALPFAIKCVVAGVVVLALALRLAVAWKFSSLWSEDRDAYLSLARELAAGHGYVQPGSDHPTAFRPPLYPCLLAPLFGLGFDPLGVPILNVLLGIVTAAVVAVIACRMLAGVNVRASLIAGLVTACDPLLLYSTALPMTEVCAAAFCTMWLAAVLANRRFETPRRAFWSAFAEGALWGAATLCRPVFLPVGACVALVPATGERLFREPAGWRVRLLGIACGLTVAVSPWLIRNAHEFGRFLMTTTHGGYTLLLGHNSVYYAKVVNGHPGAVWDGQSLGQWQASLEQELREADVRADDEFSRDAWFQAQARRMIQRDPQTAVRSGLTLWGRFWSISPKSVESRPLPGVVVSLISVWNIALFALASVGLVRLLRRRLVLGRVALLAVLVFSAVHFWYWSDQRMRAPLVPILACLAAAACAPRAALAAPVVVCGKLQ